MRNGQPRNGDTRASDAARSRSARDLASRSSEARADSARSSAARAVSARSGRDDFFCWKFRVWYNLDDCVFRHVHRTTHDCASCEQGAGNVRLVRRKPDAPRWVRLLSVDDLDAARAGNGRP